MPRAASSCCAGQHAACSCLQHVRGEQPWLFESHLKSPRATASLALSTLMATVEPSHLPRCTVPNSPLPTCAQVQSQVAAQHSMQAASRHILQSIQRPAAQLVWATGCLAASCHVTCCMRPGAQSCSCGVMRGSHSSLHGHAPLPAAAALAGQSPTRAAAPRPQAPLCRPRRRTSASTAAQTCPAAGGSAEVKL